MDNHGSASPCTEATERGGEKLTIANGRLVCSVCMEPSCTVLWCQPLVFVPVLYVGGYSRYYYHVRTKLVIYS
jgi:hypothetical protein